jgi:hypothetical protein
MSSSIFDNLGKDLDHVFEPLVVRGYRLEQITHDTLITVDGTDLKERYCYHEEGDKINHDTGYISDVTSYQHDLQQLFAAKGTARKFLRLQLNNLSDDNGDTGNPNRITVDVTWIDHNGELKYDSQYNMSISSRSMVIDLNNVPDSHKPPGFVLKANLTITAYDAAGNSTIKNFLNITL